MQVDVIFQRGDLGIFEREGIGHIRASDASQGSGSLLAPAQLGCHENMDLIHMATIAESTEQPGATLDKHVGHLP